MTGNKKGFTLVEVVVALSIFAIATTYSIDLFVQSNTIQKRTANIQRVMADARYGLEVMAREVRLGNIDYNYANYSRDAGGNLTWPQAELAIRDADNQPIRFRRNEVEAGRFALQVCSGQDVCNAADWLDITPAELSVVNLAFYIAPGKDPFAWDAALVDYPADVQPHVTIVLETKSLLHDLPTEKISHLQTTVTSRKYLR
ncbi:MAG: type II secretion system protein [Candidatus Komeilibacteria bacterium]|nr:type II secretion system protein [Candidatus Komeilibacteria bacterium]